MRQVMMQLLALLLLRLQAEHLDDDSDHGRPTIRKSPADCLVDQQTSPQCHLSPSRMKNVRREPWRAGQTIVDI